jgi:hypothetical protein
MSMARLRRDQGKSDKARNFSRNLQSVHTFDLKEAKALLDALA